MTRCTAINKSKPVNVLLVMHGAGSGGVETALATLCKYLDRDRVKVTVAVPSNGPFTDRLKSFGIEVINTPIEWWTPANWEFGERRYYRFLSTIGDRVKRIASIIKEKQIDAIHSSTLTVLDGALAARIAGRPHIWNIRGCYEGGPDSSFGAYLPIQTIYDVVDTLSTLIVANSHTVKNFLINYLPANRIDVIQNGVDLERFSGGIKEAAQLDRDFPELSGKLKVALVGRISPVKGIEDFVSAAIKVAQKRDDVGFVIVGPVEDRNLFEKSKNIINQHRLSDRVVFTGRREDVPALINEIDLFVCTSISEGLPNSCLEAMAAAKAVVATRCGGAEELICDGENGYLTSVGNPVELASTILKALEDADRLKRMGARGKEIAITQFNANICASKYEGLYFQLRDQSLTNASNKIPWNEIFLHMASNLGEIGLRTIQLEREVRDLRSFKSLLKDNFFYRIVRRIVQYF